MISFKSLFGSDIRRFRFDGSPTLVAIWEKLAALYELPSNTAVFTSGAVSLKWQDADGDFVTISTDDDLAEALRASGEPIRLIVSTDEAKLGELAVEEEQEQEQPAQEEAKPVAAKRVTFAPTNSEEPRDLLSAICQFNKTDLKHVDPVERTSVAVQASTTRDQLLAEIRCQSAPVAALALAPAPTPSPRQQLLADIRDAGSARVGQLAIVPAPAPSLAVRQQLLTEIREAGSTSAAKDAVPTPVPVPSPRSQLLDEIESVGQQRAADRQAEREARLTQIRENAKAEQVRRLASLQEELKSLVLNSCRRQAEADNSAESEDDDESSDSEEKLSCAECHSSIEFRYFKCGTCENYVVCPECEAHGAHYQHILLRLQRGVSQSDVLKWVPEGQSRSSPQRRDGKQRRRSERGRMIALRQEAAEASRLAEKALHAYNLAADKASLAAIARDQFAEKLAAKRAGAASE